MYRTAHQNNKGFTIIEVIIASGLFVTITLIAIGALVNITRNYRQTGEIRQVLDTMQFVMEDMARNLRLGTNIHCFGSTGSTNIEEPASCPSGSLQGRQAALKIAFEAQDGDTTSANDQKIYWIYPIDGQGRLFKSSTGEGADPDQSGTQYVQITPDAVSIDMAKSGFSVAEGPVPLTVIRLVGKVKYQGTDIPFAIQTSISPRNLPVPAL